MHIGGFVFRDRLKGYPRIGTDSSCCTTRFPKLWSGYRICLWAQTGASLAFLASLSHGLQTAISFAVSWTPCIPEPSTVSDEFLSIVSADLTRLCFPGRYLITLSPYWEPLWIEGGKKMRLVMLSDINWGLILILLMNPWVTPGKSVSLFQSKISSPWKTGKRTMSPWRWLWGIVSKMKLIKDK